MIVGGTAQENDWNLEISSQDTEEIWKGVCNVFPSLQKATIVCLILIIILIPSLIVYLI